MAVTGKQCNQAAMASMRLGLVGDAMLRLLQVKQMSTREEALKCIELMRSSNPELVRWVHDITSEPVIAVREGSASAQPDAQTKEGQ